MAATGQERLRLEGVCKSFRAPVGAVPVLREVNLSLAAGEFGVITGPSGSGKTTLLTVAGLLQDADAGRIWFDGREVSGLGEGERADIRKHGAGMVFQKFCLLPHRSALDNVQFRFRYLAQDARTARVLARAALDRVGLADKAAQPARLLSAGEMQRVAIARALAQPPRLLLADEPTGNLDSKTGEEVLHYLFELAAEQGLTLVMVTHNEAVAARCRRHVELRDGRPVA